MKTNDHSVWANRKEGSWLCIVAAAIALQWTGIQVQAGPSGGPYGPVQQMYTVPGNAPGVYYVAPDGKAENTGESVDMPTTLEAAIERVQTGDAIILRGGTYRTGNLVLNQGITMQPYADEMPVLKGTYVAKDWHDLGNGLWITSWNRLFPSKPDNWWMRLRQGKETPLYRFNNDMVFVDGKFLQAVGWEGDVDEGTYYIDYENNRVYIGIDPADRLVEITAFDVAILRTVRECHGKKPDKKGFVLRGVTLTQYAYRALEIEGAFPEGVADEAGFGKDVVGTKLEHCTISNCSRVAGYFKGDSLVIRHCRISDTSTEGLYIQSSNDVLLEKNILTRNNIERITGYFPAAVKIFNQCHRVTCQDNLVIDLPYSNGIWYDVGNVDGRFLNNWIEGVGNSKDPFSIERPWPSENGFFFEISKGAICAGNVFVNCDHGLWVLNSSDVIIYNNTFVNSTACIGRTERSAAGDHFGWHPSTGPDVDERDGHAFVNNLMTGDATFHRLFLFVWQPAALCKRLSTSQLRDLDHNVYVRSVKSSDPLILWSPVKNKDCRALLDSPAGLHGLQPAFSNSSLFLDDYHGPLFKSPELGHFQALSGFPGLLSGTAIPEVIKEKMGISPEQDKYVGAYPPPAGD